MIKKITSMVLILLLLVQYAGVARAADTNTDVQPAPQKLRVEAINNTAPNMESAIGYNGYDKYYADLKSDKLDKPDIAYSTSQYLNYYLQEVNKGYKPVKPVILKEGNVTGNTSGENRMRLKNLTSGTVYYAHSKAYYTYTRDNTTYKSAESASSNSVKFLTDIDISAYSYGPNQIKIEWDDVWNSGKRMDYRLYISENSSFTNTPPIYIGQEQISPSGPVTVNEATGKLEYIHTVLDAGRVYYIKIAPDTTDTELKMSAESKAVTVSSFILAKTTKMSVTEDGTIWKLEWTPVVTGLADSTVKVSYQIYKGSGTGSSIEQYMASVDDTTFFLTLQPGGESNYYIIKAIVTRNGQDVYPGIKIQSQKIYVKESEVVSHPAVPELVEEFKNAGTTIISYKDELKSDRATILWKAPLKGNGEVDEDVKYDIWLITDPNSLDDPPANTMIASSVKMNSSNFVMSGTKLIGYKFVIDGLTPNSTYYFKIVAQKDYIDFVDGTLGNITLQSDPAMKIIITPTAGPIDQPVVPGRPPFQLKKDGDGKDMVTSTSAIVTLQNKWYEEYVKVAGDRYAWVYMSPTTSPGAVDLLEKNPEKVDPLKYRIVEYDDGVTIDVGCVEYTAGINYDNIGNLATSKVIGFPATPNDPDEDTTAKGAIPDGKTHNIDITISDLEPNKTYVLWVRAARRSVNLISGPSDPIIITTLPVLPDTIEKPTVPVFNYYHAGDTYIDLGWDFKSGYTYYMEYGTTDQRSSASGKVTVTPEELKNTSFYRVKGLKPDTLYYFWIQAEATNASGEKKRSDFSDSFLVKTQKDIPPSTPQGFGVKGTSDSITKNSITYEWIQEEGLNYILEIASDIDYKDGIKYEVGAVSEYTVGNLRSNFRYYARLYAYDPSKKLASEPTQSVTVRTLRSSEDYDSNDDVEDIISGDYIVKEAVAVNGVWTIKITGVNADRFIQHVQTDKVLDYCINLTVMPAGTKTINILISQRVFRALAILGENLSVKTQRNTLVIRPGVLADSNGVYGTVKGEANFQFSIVLDSTTQGSSTNNLTFKTPVTELKIGLSDGIVTPVGKLEKPLKVLYEYTSASWYQQGVTAGYTLADGATAWNRSEAAGSFNPDSNLGVVSFETNIPGHMAIAEPGADYYTDISKSYAKKSIANVASVHKLKSVTGTKFEPDKYLTVGDGAKLMLDMLDTSYGSNYMTLAVRTGIVQSADSNKPGANCTREKLIAMVVRVCELKTSQKATATANETGIYKDIGQVSASLLPKIKFAQENGVITTRFSDTLGPKDPVTRAEAMVLLEKMLRFAGEL